MHRFRMLLGIVVAAAGGGVVSVSAFGDGATGAFGSGTFNLASSLAVITVNATNTGDGVTATGSIQYTYSSGGTTYITTANVLCVVNTGGLILVGSVVTDTNLPAGPGPGLVVVIQDNGPSGDRVGTGFEPPPVTSQTSDCEVSPTIFPLLPLTSGNFSSTNVPPPTSPQITTTTATTTTSTITAAAPLPLIIGPKISPTPRAGSTVLVSFRVSPSHNTTASTTGKITLTPSVDGQALKYTPHLKGDAVSLRIALPPGSGGRTLKIRVTVGLGGQSTARVVTFRIGHER
jgi:hypothetical protein